MHNLNGRRGPLRTAWLPVAAALVALVTAGCGSNDATESETTTAAGGTPVRIGVLVNETGAVLSGEQRAPAVLRAWADTRNAEGGVAGHPVELVIEDTKGDAATATAAATSLANDDSIAAVILFDANAESISADALIEAGLPVIGGMGFDPGIWGVTPNWFAVTTTFPSSINAGMVLADSVGATQPAFTVCAEVATCEAIGGIAENASNALGLDYAGTIKVGAAVPDYTAQCLSLNEEGVDFIALGHSAQVNMRFARNCKTQGYDGGLGLTSAGVEPEVLKSSDPGLPIDLALTAFPWYADDPPAAEYREMMEAAGVPEDSWGDPHGTAAYATLELFRTALENHADELPETVSNDDVIAAYGTVENETLDGLLPQPMTFSPGEPGPLVSCYWLGRFDAGTFSGDPLDEPTCDPPSLEQQG